MTEAVAATSKSSDDHGFTAYEYLAVQAPRERESLYRDIYLNLGWEADGSAADASHEQVSLKFKRDRAIRNRPMLQELQRKSDRALNTVETMERSKTRVPTALATVVGIIGAGLLAGAVFSLNESELMVSIVLGAVGLIAWALTPLVFTGLRSRRTARVTPVLERQYDALHDSGLQAARLIG